ncbi:MAG: [LysW]-lysine hydrolase [Chloroflexi bacterium]|nr:[LysW]-lysine hydrolase [Chloroflexota bacterium]
MTPVSDCRAEQLLHDLVAIASPSRHESKAATHLVAWMRAQGYDEAFIDDAGNAVGIRGAGSRQIALLGHIDTFAGFPPVRQAGRRLYGRGAVDAKGPLCAFAAAVQRAKLPDDLQVVVIGAVEEEAATSRGARYAATQYQPDYCVIGEPSAWDRITMGYKGRLLLDWTWRGGLSHSAGQEPSPAERAVVYWQRVKEACDEINAGIGSIFARLDPSLRDIHTWQEGVDGIAEMTVGFRLPPGVDPRELTERFPPADGATISARGGELACQSERNSPLSREFRRAIRSCGGAPRFVYKTGTSDMNVVAPLWNCPILAYGPGDSTLDHTPQEHIDLEEYLRAIAVLTTVLQAL